MKPLILAFLKFLDDVLLIHQVFLVLAEILGADVLDFVELLVVLINQAVTLLGSFIHRVFNELS